MDTEGVKTIVLAFAAISTSVQWWVNHRNRRKDATWVEVMKGQIRRDVDADLKAHEITLQTQADLSIERVKGEIRNEVEENLKTHESRLRVQADLRLRAHEREWELLRGFTASAWVAYEAIVDYALVIGNDEEDRGQRHAAAYDAMTRLNVTSAAMPPRAGDVDSAIKEFLAAFHACNEFLADDPQGEDRGRRTMSIRDQAQRGITRTHALVARWNDALWRESTPEALIATPSGSDRRSGGTAG